MREREKDAKDAAVDGEYVERTSRVRRKRSTQGGVALDEGGGAANCVGGDAAARASGDTG
jgi:hypothetical protein